MNEESVSPGQAPDDYAESPEQADIGDAMDSEDRARMMLAEDEGYRAAEMAAQDQMDAARGMDGRMAPDEDSGNLGEWVVNESE